jgi:hypothetical protein
MHVTVNNFHASCMDPASDKFHPKKIEITISLPSAGWQNSKNHWHATRFSANPRMPGRHAPFLTTGDELDDPRGTVIVLVSVNDWKDRGNIEGSWK